MKDYKREILVKLLEKYERSKLYVIQKARDEAARSALEDHPEQEERASTGPCTPNESAGVDSGARNVILRYSKKEFPDYWDESSAEKRQSINLATLTLESQGIIRVQRATWDRETVEKVYLRLERLDDAYEIAGRCPRTRKEASMEKVVTKWLRRWKMELESADRDPFPPASASESSGEMTGHLDDPGFPPTNRVFCLRAGIAFLKEFEVRLNSCLSLPCSFSLDDAERLEDVCKAIDSLSRLTSEMPARVFSVRVFRDSKRIETISTRLMRVLCEFGDLNELGIDKSDFQNPSELNDVLSAELGIVSNPIHVFVSGPLKLKGEGRVIDLSGFVPDVGLPEKMVRDFEIVDVGSDSVITVENLTPFCMLAQALCQQRGGRRECLLVYLGGYHNKTRREFLRKIYQKYIRDGRLPQFLHWGDIDLGGFRIYHHLTKRTGIPIQPLLMDEDTYHAYSVRGKPLSWSYRKELEALLDDPRYQIFQGVIRAILERGVVVEQESVDVEEVLRRCGGEPHD